MSAFEIRPRSPTEIVDAAFEILRRHYLTIITMTAAVQLPIIILELMLRNEPTGAFQMSAPTILAALLLVFALLIGTVLSDGVVIHAVSEVFLGRPMSAGRSIAHVWRRIIPLIFSGMIRGIASGLAALALIVPGVYVWGRYAAVGAVAVLEERGTGETAERAWKLGEGRVGDSLLALLLAGVVYFALAFVLTYGVQMLGGLLPVLLQPGVNFVVQQLPAVLFYPLISVVTTLIYYDLRVRKEGFDLEMMAKELGGPAPAPAA